MASKSKASFEGDRGKGEKNQKKDAKMNNEGDSIVGKKEYLYKVYYCRDQQICELLSNYFF